MGCSRTPAFMRCLKGERSGLSASSSSISFAFARAALSASESFTSIALFGFGVDAGVDADADADAGVVIDFVLDPADLGVFKNENAFFGPSPVDFFGVRSKRAFAFAFTTLAT